MTLTYKKSEKIVDRKLRQERILVPIGGHVDELDALFTLNEVASFIWDTALQGSTATEIAKQVATTFDVDLSTASADTDDLLKQFIDLGALQPHPLEA